MSPRINIYTRVRRITLYQQDEHLKSFFLELDAMPADVANRALLEAVEHGYDAALQHARQEIERRKSGEPRPTPFQPFLFGGAQC